MSFILDALRKSESERRTDARPSITRIPDSVPQRPTPRWAVATIAVLTVVALGLAGAWLSSLSDTAPSGTPAASVPHEQAVPGRRLRSAALPLPPARPASSADTAGRSTAGAPSTPRTSLRQAAAAGAEHGNDRTEPIRPPQQNAVLEALPADYASSAPSLGLPALRLELHAYDGNPSKRFVFIDGSRYGEGDTLPNGTRVLAINASGAVLLAAGRQLQLRPE